MLPESVQESCESLLQGAAIQKATPVGGGDINEARLLYTDSGRYFLKMNDHPAALDMFEAEAAGLRLIQAEKTIRTPAVVGYNQSGHKAFLLLEYIESGHRSAGFWQDFGRQLAQLHHRPQPHFGLHRDNYIGSLPQPNPILEDWPAFYRQARLEPQLDLAKKHNRLQTTDFQQFDQLLRKLPDLLPNEPPSLIHGDLWSGNFLADAKGEPVLIDPAAGYAHREMDIAMSKLFGGFAPGFYEAYDAAYPLLTGWQERVPLYQLYYLLVHVNLFGGGYVQSVRQVLRQFI